MILRIYNIYFFFPQTQEKKMSDETLEDTAQIDQSEQNAFLLFRLCNENDIDDVKTLLPFLSLDEINCRHKYKGPPGASFLPVTACFIAVFNGHLEIVKLLLKAGCNFNIGTQYLGTPLHAACASGNLEMTKLLVKAGADLYNTTGTYGRTPFHYAIFNGQLTVVKYLLECGYDIHYLGPSGYSNLAYASMKNQPAIVEFLLIAELNLLS